MLLLIKLCGGELLNTLKNFRFTWLAAVAETVSSALHDNDFSVEIMLFGVLAEVIGVTHRNDVVAVAMEVQDGWARRASLTNWTHFNEERCMFSVDVVINRLGDIADPFCPIARLAIGFNAFGGNKEFSVAKIGWTEAVDDSEQWRNLDAGELRVADELIGLRPGNKVG